MVLFFKYKQEQETETKRQIVTHEGKTRMKQGFQIISVCLLPAGVGNCHSDSTSVRQAGYENIVTIYCWGSITILVICQKN